MCADNFPNPKKEKRKKKTPLRKFCEFLKKEKEYYDRIFPLNFPQFGEISPF
jgi:hypothetical protein